MLGWFRARRRRSGITLKTGQRSSGCQATGDKTVTYQKGVSTTVWFLVCYGLSLRIHPH